MKNKKVKKILNKTKKKNLKIKNNTKTNKKVSKVKQFKKINKKKRELNI